MDGFLAGVNVGGTLADHIVGSADCDVMVTKKHGDVIYIVQDGRGYFGRAILKALPSSEGSNPKLVVLRNRIASV